MFLALQRSSPGVGVKSRLHITRGDAASVTSVSILGPWVYVHFKIGGTVEGKNDCHPGLPHFSDRLGTKEKRHRDLCFEEVGHTGLFYEELGKVNVACECDRLTVS